ncbi:radical SAM protein [Methanothrix sp.]|uniref:radical SAM protein n=1 Tax=Methanothrix sp. TaxID=90426 RepID=UPI003C7433DC
MSLFHVTKESEIPLVGCLYFGVVDRGSNLLQIRPSCGCNLSCPFCSVDAGPHSRSRVTDYQVELDYLMEAVEEIAPFKGEGVECHIDSPGEPMLYPDIVELVRRLKDIEDVAVVSMQSNGTRLDEGMIASLEEAGLDRINLSMHALEPELAAYLAGRPGFDIKELERVAVNIARSRIDLLIAPVYIPGINDLEIPKLIDFARRVGAGKRWPPLGIQKFEHYRLGRSPRGVRAENWWHFYNRSMPQWERDCSLPLRLKAQDFGIEKRPMIPTVFKKNEKTRVEIKAPGWVEGEQLGVAKNRVVSVVDSPVSEGGLRVKIVSNKHNIYVAVPYR